MQANSVTNQPNFKGLFQGLALRKNNKFLSYPRNPMDGCVYSDRLMMRIVRKAASSKKYLSKLNINLIEEKGEKKLSLEMPRTDVSKLIPLPIKLLGGRAFNLPNEHFWRILADRRFDKIKYQLPQKHLDKMVDYFYNPKLPSEQLRKAKEDSSIKKKTAKFKKALLKIKTHENKENQSWLNEFFSTSGI